MPTPCTTSKWTTLHHPMRLFCASGTDKNIKLLLSDVEQLFLCINGECNLPLKIRFVQFCLAFKSFSITYPKTFFNNRCHLQPCRVCELQCPWAPVFNLFFWEQATKRQDCFESHSGYRGNLSLWENPLPDWKLDGLCLCKHLGLVSHL